MSKRFDIYVTGPVEALPGIRLFLSRAAASLLGRGSSGYFGLTTLEASKMKCYRIQQMLLEMDFVVTDIKRKFDVIFRMVGVKMDCDWYTSSFIGEVYRDDDSLGTPASFEG